MVQGSREAIVNAVFRIARKNPNQREITMAEIAKEAGISRQAIYQKQFSNVEEIFDYIHRSMTDEVFEVFKTSITNPKNHSIYEAVAKDIIPSVYQKRDQAYVFYHTSLDTGIFTFLEEHYIDLLEYATIDITNRGPFSNKSMMRIVINYIFSIVGEWIAEDFPDPPEVFAKKFLDLMESSPKDLIDARPAPDKK